MKRNDPVFFKKQITTLNSQPNATFLRDLGEVKGEAVCEIYYMGAPWIVRVSEIRTKDEAMTEARYELNEKIQAAREAVLPKKTKTAIAGKLGICVRTLNKWVEFVEGE